MTQCFHYPIPLPIGIFHLVEIGGKLCALASKEQLPELQKQLQRYKGQSIELQLKRTETLRQAQEQLEEYFSGARREFQLPIRLYGSDFQQTVWRQLQQITYGSTITYGTIAANLHQKGARAVGTAVGKNPLPVIVPCHRVLPQSGELGNFSMCGGPAVKAFLLDLEGAHYKK